jgi:hypothetical protein
MLEERGNKEKVQTKIDPKYKTKSVKPRSFHFSYDEVSEHYVLEIYDKDVFPLLLEVPDIKTYEVILTKPGKLNMR